MLFITTCCFPVYWLSVALRRKDYGLSLLVSYSSEIYFAVCLSSIDYHWLSSMVVVCPPQIIYVLCMSLSLFPTSHSPHLPLTSHSSLPLSPHPLTSPSPPHPLSSFTDRWYTTMLGKKSSVKNIKAYLRDKEVSQEADTFSLSALRGCASQCVLLGIRGDVEFCLFSLSLSSVMYVFLSSVMYVFLSSVMYVFLSSVMYIYHL